MQFLGHFGCPWLIFLYNDWGGWARLSEISNNAPFLYVFAPLRKRYLSHVPNGALHFFRLHYVFKYFSHFHEYKNHDWRKKTKSICLPSNEKWCSWNLIIQSHFESVWNLVMLAKTLMQIMLIQQNKEKTIKIQKYIRF